MIIKYKKDKIISEVNKVDIKDSKNIFLKGRNPYDNLVTYFGIWIYKKKIIILTIISWRNISYKCYLNEELSTENDIREYLEHNNNVEIIEKEEFKEQIQYIKSLLEI